MVLELRKALCAVSSILPFFLTSLQSCDQLPNAVHLLLPFLMTHMQVTNSRGDWLARLTKKRDAVDVICTRFDAMA